MLYNLHTFYKRQKPNSRRQGLTCSIESASQSSAAPAAMDRPLRWPGPTMIPVSSSVLSLNSVLVGILRPLEHKSSLLSPLSSVLYSLSFLLCPCPLSTIAYPFSSVLCPLSTIVYPLSGDRYLIACPSWPGNFLVHTA